MSTYLSLLFAAVAVACAQQRPQRELFARGSALDTLAIRRAVAVHYSQPDSTVSSKITITADTAMAVVSHGTGGTATVARLEFRNGRWQFVREEAVIVR